MKTPERIYLKDYTPPAFFIDQVDLVFDIQEDQTIVTSCMKFRKNLDVSDDSTPLVLHKDTCEITQVVAGGMVLLPGEYEMNDDSLTLASTPDVFELEVTNIVKPQENTRLEGLYFSNDILCTQCEAQGFRRITPFLDRPDVMSVFSCTLIADREKYPILLSNGNLINTGKLEEGRHFARWEDPFHKPSYLFALVAGDMAVLEDTFETDSGRTVDLRIYSAKENIHQCGHAMTSLKQAMAWDERRFGLEYDLDLYQIVAISDFNAGAMENKGLNIFNAKYVIADPKTATDQDFMNIQAVIGHEYFHNWTGNRVTLKNWFQLSLKEGLTVFRDQEFSSDLNSRSVKRIADVSNLRSCQFPEDAGPMAHPVRPESYIKMDNFYTMTVYEKGAELIRMIHQLLGEELFQKGMKLYFKKFDHMAVAIDDFVSVMAEVSGKDLGQFKRWYSQSGTPEVKMVRKYNSRQKLLGITFEQKTVSDHNQEVKQPLHIPIRIGIIDPLGNEILAKNQQLIELTRTKEKFTFPNIPENSLPSIFRQFSAPVRVTTDFSDDELSFLMAQDNDEFNRWDAAQTLFFKELFKIITDLENNRKPSVSTNLMTAFQQALTNEHLDRSFLSKALLLPSEMQIKDRFETADVDTIHEARSLLKKIIAKQLENDLVLVMERCSTSDPLGLSRDAMADRSLKNLSLSYLGCLDDERMQDLVWQRFESAKNMTDELACFKVLANMDINLKSKACDRFYDKWQKDALVLDKWFAIQAASVLPDTLTQVEQLLAHPDFSIKNPNRARSLIYVFAMNNPVHFHNKKGGGYSLIADQIIALDRINPMVAARLVSCFNHWKKYDPERQSLMKEALERIGSVKTLSKNVYEIVTAAVRR